MARFVSGLVWIDCGVKFKKPLDVPSGFFILSLWRRGVGDDLCLNRRCVPKDCSFFWVRLTAWHLNFIYSSGICNIILAWVVFDFRKTEVIAIFCFCRSR